MPDFSFIRADRVQKSKHFIEGPPDVAFEVVSPSDTYTEIEKRTADYLRGGAGAVVIVDPSTKSVRIHRASGVTTVADSIELPDILPGWSLPLRDLFD